MEESVYQILNINSNQLDELLEYCHRQYQDNHQVFILDDQYDFFMKYVKEHIRSN